MKWNLSYELLKFWLGYIKMTSQVIELKKRLVYMTAKLQYTTTIISMLTALNSVVLKLVNQCILVKPCQKAAKRSKVAIWLSYGIC